MTLDVWCLTAGCHIVIPTQISPNLCTSLVTVQILMRAFRWLFFFPPWLPRMCGNKVQRDTHLCARALVCVQHACACVCGLCVHICVCTQAHLIRLVCVRECVRPCVCVCLPCSKVSHLSGRWLRVANGRLDRWVHCSTLAAVASAQVTASPAQWWCQCWWVAGGLTTLFWWQNDSTVRFATSLAFFRFVSLYWEV